MHLVASPSDIVVVGAGIVGCAVAYELARRGASVEIIDDRPAGMGATQASAGVLAPFIEASDGGPLLDLTTRSLDMFDAFVSDAAADSGCAVNYERTGSLDVSLSTEAFADLAARHACLLQRGFRAELLDAAAVQAAEPQLSEHATGGLLIPAHGFVAAAELTRALAAAARRHTAQLIERGRVRRVLPHRGELQVETDRGTLTAEAVVIAAGSWTGAIEIEGESTQVPVKPIRGQLLQLAWNGPRLRRVVWGERCYLVPWREGTVLVGATVEDVGFDERTTVAGVRMLIDAACELLPNASTAAVLAPKVGLRPATPDHLPVIGFSESVPNLMYATGHYRNGVLLAPLTAHLVARAMLDGVCDPMLEHTRPQRFGQL
jgi:glycine oxidase